MRHIRNLTFLLLTACSETQPEEHTTEQVLNEESPQGDVTMTIKTKVHYSKSKDVLLVPITLHNNTSTPLDLALYNFYYQLLDGKEELATGKNAGLGLTRYLMKIGRAKKNKNNELFIKSGQSIELDIRVDEINEKTLLSKKQLNIRIQIEDYQGALFSSVTSDFLVLGTASATNSK